MLQKLLLFLFVTLLLPKSVLAQHTASDFNRCLMTCAAVPQNDSAAEFTDYEPFYFYVVPL